MAALIRPDFRPARSRGPLSHHEAAGLHAITRLRERYGTHLGPRDVDLHEQAIAVGECERISVHGSRVLYAVQDRRRVFYAIWCRRIRRIVTYLPGPCDLTARQLHRRSARS